MTQPDNSDSLRIVVVETSDHHWRFQQGSDHIVVYKGDGLRIEIGFNGFGDASVHGIELPAPVVANLIEWLGPRWAA